MARLKCWEKAKTGYEARWNQTTGSNVVVIAKVGPKGNRYEAMQSHAVGGWHSLGVGNKTQAMKNAKSYMRKTKCSPL